MNDSEFEDSLRALMPSAPPPAMEGKIAAELSGRESEPAARESAAAKRQPVSIRFEQAPEPLIVRCFHSLGWAIAGAASAVAAIVLFSKPAPERPAAPVAAAPTVAVATAPASASNKPLDDAGAYPEAETSAPLAASVPFSANIRPAAETKDELQGVETTRELISSEEGTQVIFRSNGSDSAPMHQVRNVYREHHSWIDPSTGARVEIEVPREDVFLKPVSLQ